MKTYTKNLIRILILIIPLLFLSACEDYDTQVLENAFEAWAEKNDVYVNGQWKPEGVVLKAAQDTLGSITNSDANVQFDAVEDVIRDIEQADDLAEEALRDLDADKMSLAVSIRPLDWRLLEQEGVVWLANDNGAAAQTSFTKSDDLLRESLLGGGDCFKLRRAQLETRLFTLAEAITNLQISPGADVGVMRAEHRRVADELFTMNNTNQSDFCGYKENK
jgi:hypothetical protein